MSTFSLEILTPERLFFDEPVEALTTVTVDGEITILKGHAPITLPLVVGKLRIKQNGTWREAFQSEGFLEVNQSGAHLFAQACKWPEEIDVRRAEAAQRRAEEELRQKHSMMEYQASKIALARAMARLRITHQKVNLD